MSFVFFVKKITIVQSNILSKAKDVNIWFSYSTKHFV